MLFVLFGFVFTSFQAVPFLLELRALLDWSCTETVLSLMYWFKVEDIRASVYIIKSFRDDERVRERERMSNGFELADPEILHYWDIFIFIFSICLSEFFTWLPVPHAEVSQAGVMFAPLCMRTTPWRSDSASALYAEGPWFKSWRSNFAGFGGGGGSGVRSDEGIPYYLKLAPNENERLSIISATVSPSCEPVSAGLY